MFPPMLTDASYHDDDNVIPIRYCYDEKVFSMRWLQDKSKGQTDVSSIGCPILLMC